MQQIEFGDFQTPNSLAKEVIELISNQFPIPDIVIEPTCGLGNFIEESSHIWSNQPKYFGFELNDKYYSFTREKFSKNKNIKINSQNFFTFDWDSFFSNFKNKQITILGNPPWVSNATIGAIDGSNLPHKSNFQKLKGFDAKTGKANFDIAEWIIIKLIDSMKTSKGNLALLCKNATARKVLSYFGILPINYTLPQKTTIKRRIKQISSIIRDSLNKIHPLSEIKPYKVKIWY